MIEQLNQTEDADGQSHLTVVLGRMPEPDMSHQKALDDCDEETSYSADAVEEERKRCYWLGVTNEAAGGASAVERVVRRCRWDYDEDMDAHETECGNAFRVSEGTPAENDMKFCPYCGGDLWESCGKRNDGVRCRMQKGSTCPDCGLGLHDFGGQD